MIEANYFEDERNGKQLLGLRLETGECFMKEYEQGDIWQNVISVIAAFICERLNTEIRYRDSTGRILILGPDHIKNQKKLCDILDNKEWTKIYRKLLNRINMN